MIYLYRIFPPSTPPSCPDIFFQTYHSPSISSSENIKPRRDKQSNRTKQGIIRQGKCPHMKAEQGNSIG